MDPAVVKVQVVTADFESTRGATSFPTVTGDTGTSRAFETPSPAVSKEDVMLSEQPVSPIAKSAIVKIA